MWTSYYLSLFPFVYSKLRRDALTKLLEPLAINLSTDLVPRQLAELPLSSPELELAFAFCSLTAVQALYVLSYMYV